jgi:NAD(P)-dependent dehydrogenase (short-subunit alcohol dehydrogenase family)
VKRTKIAVIPSAPRRHFGKLDVLVNNAGISGSRTRFLQPKPGTGSSSSPLAEACYRVRSFTGLNRFEQLFNLSHELMLAAVFAESLKVADYHLLPFSLGKDDAAMCEVLIARFLHPVQRTARIARKPVMVRQEKLV